MDWSCDGYCCHQLAVLCFGVNLPLVHHLPGKSTDKIDFSVITGSSSNIKEPANIAMLSIALALFPTFVYWMQRQENRGKPAVIPNSIWKNTAFTCSCISVFLTWGAFNPFGYFTTLLYVQLLTRPNPPLKKSHEINQTLHIVSKKFKISPHSKRLCVFSLLLYVAS